MVAVRHFPPIDDARTRIEGPVGEVTLLEDRAQVRRSFSVELAAGVNRLAIENVAPTLQDVSLGGRVTTAGARLTDVRCRRAMRVWHEDQPTPLADIEAEIESLRRDLRHTSEDRARTEARHQSLFDIVRKGADEVPTDASWGVINQQVWRDTFDTLFTRMNTLHQQTYDLYHRQIDLDDTLKNAAKRRAAAVSTLQRFVGWLELDVLADRAGAFVIEIEYVVPNALWRPMHQARLMNGRVKFSSSAVVWQNTQEDWRDVQLVFSTARSALGTEPPILSDDLLVAQRRAEQVTVEARQVRVQRAKVEGGPGAASSAGRELPGVDDGGEVQMLRGVGRHDVPSDGRPVIVPLGHFEAPCDARLVSMPELQPKAFLETQQHNDSGRPILAGPVELVKDHGFVGWTSVLFVAPTERFSLSFGPDDAVRLTRTDRAKNEVRHVDDWRVTTTTVAVFLSNLSGDPKAVHVTERIPVSEVEQVRVTVIDEAGETPQVDDDGFVKWTVDLAPHGRERRTLVWSVAVAPGVDGL